MWPRFEQLKRLSLSLKTSDDKELQSVIRELFSNYSRNEAEISNVMILQKCENKTWGEALNFVAIYVILFLENFEKLNPEQKKYSYRLAFKNLSDLFFSSSSTKHYQIWAFFSESSYYVPLMNYHVPLDSLQQEYVYQLSKTLQYFQNVTNGRIESFILTRIKSQGKTVHQRHILFENTEDFANYCLFIKKGRVMNLVSWCKYFCFCKKKSFGGYC